MSFQDIGASHSNAFESAADQTLGPKTDSMDLERIYSQYVGPIYRFLYARVGNRQDAEDLVAETFVKASRHLDVYRPEASIARWLFTVARTVLADHWRKYYRDANPLSLDELNIDPVMETATPAAQHSETERQVAGILEALPPRYRRVLELRFLGGFSVLETAQEMGVTPGNAKVLQYRALAKAVCVVSHPPCSSSAS